MATATGLIKRGPFRLRAELQLVDEASQMRGSDMEVKKLRFIDTVLIAIVALIGSAFSEQSTNEDVNTQINRVLHLRDFRGPELEKLMELPLPSVAALTERLRTFKPGEKFEPRTFGFLVIKLEQFHAMLPDETKSAALEPLSKNSEIEEDNDREFRKSNVRELKQVIEGAIPPFGIGLQENYQAIFVAKLKQSPATHVSPTIEPQSTSLTVWVVAAVAGFWLVWLLIKRLR